MRLHLLVVCLILALCITSCTPDVLPAQKTETQTDDPAPDQIDAEPQTGDPADTPEQEPTDTPPADPVTPPEPGEEPQDTPQVPVDPEEPEEQEPAQPKPAEPEQVEPEPGDDPGADPGETPPGSQPVIYAYNRYYHWDENTPDEQEYHLFVDGNCSVCACSLFMVDPVDGLVTRASSSSTGDVVIPAEVDGVPVTELPPYLLSYSYLDSVTIPASVEAIGQYVFSHSNCLESVTLENPTGWYVLDQYSYSDWRARNVSNATPVSLEAYTPQELAQAFSTGSLQTVYLFRP